MTDDYKFQITDDDPISLYNYAKQCQDAGDTDDALIFYNKSITADSTCPHGWYGMSYIYFQQGAYDIAFKKSCQGVKEADYSKYHDPIHFELGQIMLDSASKLAEKINIVSYNNSVFKELEQKGNCKIYCKDFKQDEISSFLGFGPDYNQDFHNIVYNSALPDSEYRILHELIHLKFKIENHKKGIKLPYTFSNKAYQLFYYKNIATYQNKYKKFSPTDLNKRMSNDFTQLYALFITNIIDLFIEKEIYYKIPELRPLQVLSTIAENKRIEKRTLGFENHMPTEIFHKIMIINHLEFLNLKELYGMNQITDIPITSELIKKAEELYQICKEAMYSSNFCTQIATTMNIVAEKLELKYLLE